MTHTRGDGMNPEGNKQGIAAAQHRLADTQLGIAANLAAENARVAELDRAHEARAIAHEERSVRQEARAERHTAAAERHADATERHVAAIEAVVDRYGLIADALRDVAEAIRGRQ